MASKTNGVDSTAEWARAPPPSGPVWLRIAKAIYNPDEKSFMGRTPKRWGIVITFYLVFYSVLALLFALCMGGLFLSIDYTKPTYTLDRSLIGANPGVAFRPRPDYGVAAVWYNHQNESEYQAYTDQLDEFLQPYQNESWYSAKSGCNAEENYGFPDAPCFFIKLNKIFDWKPEYYDDDSNSLPEDMPEDLVEHIRGLALDERKQVWISCWEEKNNSTKIDYPWGRGLPGRFYPYLNEPGYRSPLLAIRLVPSVNTLTTVRCRTWAKNIIYNRSLKDPLGYTRIQLYVEDSNLYTTEIFTESVSTEPTE